MSSGFSCFLACRSANVFKYCLGQDHVNIPHAPLAFAWAASAEEELSPCASVASASSLEDEASEDSCSDPETAPGAAYKNGCMFDAVANTLVNFVELLFMQLLFNFRV